MAKVIADALGGDSDVVLVHKLSHPEELELAIGAIDDSGNAIVTDYAARVDRSISSRRSSGSLQLCGSVAPGTHPCVRPSILKVALSSWSMMA